MVIKIQRWSPDTCGCVIEQQVEYDDKGASLGVQFLLMNRVCDAHKHMMSTRKMSNHQEKASNVLSLIEEAKRVNLAQVDEQIAKATRNLERKDLQECRKLVIQFNARLDEEWGELVELDHAFDSHIHDQVLMENKEQQRIRLLRDGQ